MFVGLPHLTHTTANIASFSLSLSLSLSELQMCVLHIAVMINQFIYDEFMRMFIVRFCFCYYALKYRMSKELTSDSLPASYPQLPPSLLAAPSIVSMFKELATLLGLTHLYN